jgi:hypothetical protein
MFGSVTRYVKRHKEDHQNYHYAQSKEGYELVHYVLIINFLFNK